jgi:hypothetical protein
MKFTVIIYATSAKGRDVAEKGKIEDRFNLPSGSSGIAVK